MIGAKPASPKRDGNRCYQAKCAAIAQRELKAVNLASTAIEAPDMHQDFLVAVGAAVKHHRLRH